MMDLDAGPDPETPLLLSTSSIGRDHSSYYAYGTANLKSASPSPSPAHSIRSGSVSSHVDHLEDNALLPEMVMAAPQTRRLLGWGSAYILIISRVIGSGIFATPGVIISSVGSIGLSLSLWFAGALISWCGLAVALEYGCMLPRSGGQYFCRCLY
jgi:amino acid permease